MRSLLPREQALLWVVGLALVIGIFYLFVFSPKTNEARILGQRVAAQRAEVARLEAQAQRKEALEREVADLQSALKVVEAKLPSAREIPNLLVELDALAGRSGVGITSVRPGLLQPMLAPGGPGAPAGPRPGGAAPAPQPKGKQAAPPQPGLQGFQQFSVELTTEGSFANILTFVRGIEAFPRFLAISDLRLNLAPQKEEQNPAQPVLTLGMTATAYVVPESGVTP